MMIKNDASARRFDSNTFDCVSRAWQAHENELRAFLVHRTGNHAMAEDLLQEVFLRSMRQGQRFCELANPHAWLFSRPCEIQLPVA